MWSRSRIGGRGLNRVYMTKGRSSLWIGGAAAILAASAAGAQTQGNSTAPVVAPQLQNFQLQPSGSQPAQTTTQGPPAPTGSASQAPATREERSPPIVAVPPAPVMPGLRLPPNIAPQQRPTAVGPRPAPNAARPASPQQAAPSSPTQVPQAAPTPEAGPTATTPGASGVAAPAGPQASPEPTPESTPISIPGEPMTPSTGGMLPIWVEIAGGGALVLLLGFLMWRRGRPKRRLRAEALAEAEAAAAASAAASRPPPRPTPAPSRAGEPATSARAWLEIELRAERATFNTAEALVQFELDLANVGEGPARNVRIDVKLFNAGAEQDKEIGAFFRTAGRESARVTLPGIEPGISGTIRGEVSIPREEMKALRLDERLLYIPVIAVNVLYDHGEGRTGQTSKSYVVGRELQQPSEKMGAFRVDQGPRVWRTIGQRQHKLARRL